MNSGMPSASVRARGARNDVVLALADAVATRGLRTALPLAAAIAALGVAGVAAGLLDVHAFDLDGEMNVPAVFSTLLLAAAAGLVLVYSSMARLRCDDGDRRGARDGGVVALWAGDAGCDRRSRPPVGGR